MTSSLVSHASALRGVVTGTTYDGRLDALPLRVMSDAARGMALAHGQELLPDARTRARAVLDTLCSLGLEGNVPACTAYLDRTGYKPVDRIEHSGDVDLAIRRRVFEPDADSNG